MQIDFIADVVCPWCYLGWRRLEKALAMRPDLEATITWRPYQLDPTLPEEGVDRKAYYAAKFPDPERREAGAKVLNAAAAEDGITWNLAEIPVSPNTNAAHRLIRWAQGEGLQGPVLEGVLAAYFTELRISAIQWCWRTSAKRLAWTGCGCFRHFPKESTRKLSPASISRPTRPVSLACRS